MKVACLLSVLLFAAAAYGNPVPGNNDDIILTKSNFFKDDMIKHNSENKIINLVLNYVGSLSEDDSSEANGELALFFNQISVGSDGKEVNMGQFVLKNETVHKIFDGVVSTTDIGQPEVYFGAKDGLYIYNNVTMAAEKFGTVTDSIVHLDIANGTSDLYILTEPDYRIYKVSEKGTIKSLIEAIPKAVNFILDRQHNIYYHGEDNIPYILKKNSNKPERIGEFTSVNQILLVRPPFVVDDSIASVIDGKVYVLYATGKTQETSFKIAEKLTSVSMELGILQYYGVDGEIYELNVLEVFFKALLGKLDEILCELQNRVTDIIKIDRNQI